MHNHCINKLLNIKGVIVKKYLRGLFSPVCGKTTKRIYDYQFQIIKDLSLSSGLYGDLDIKNPLK